MSDVILKTNQLGIDFGGLTAVNDFNLEVHACEIAGLIGPNGAGKTTVFNLLTNVYTPTRGSIELCGKPTHGKTTVQLNHMGIARTFQNIRLFKELSVLDNVLVGDKHDARRLGAGHGAQRVCKRRVVLGERVFSEHDGVFTARLPVY